MEAQQCVELTGTNTPITHTTFYRVGVCGSNINGFLMRPRCVVFAFAVRFLDHYHTRVSVWVVGWFCGGDSGGETPG